MQDIKYSKVGNRLSPLCFLPSGKLVCYKSGNLIILENDKIEEVYPIFKSFKELYLGSIKLLSRLLRLGIRAAEAIDEAHIVLSVGNMLYEYDFTTRNLSDGFFAGEGIRPLTFTIIKGIEGFDDSIYFGGYLVNMDKKPVHIYRRTGADKWDIVYSFGQGEINHIHNIVPDSFNNCVWVFTGDFGESAAIWKFTDNFQKGERILYGQQKFRGCVAFATENGLLYATDTPFEQNYIYLMKTDGYIYPLHSLDGSCIYGCKVGKNYVFSTTVEADGRKQTLLKLCFDYSLGAGITDRYVHLVAGNTNDGFKEIYKEKKDFLPFIFQFGAFRFPKGENNSSRLYVQPYATKKNDNDTIMFDL